MKIIISILSFSFLLLSSFTKDNPEDYMEFDRTSHNFGSIIKDVPVETIFVVTNTSSSILMINSVERQCGCTTPVYSTDPIPAGQKDTITIGYNAATLGSFTKKVTVKTNFGNTDLFIKGTVDY